MAVDRSKDGLRIRGEGFEPSLQARLLESGTSRTWPLVTTFESPVALSAALPSELVNEIRSESSETKLKVELRSAQSVATREVSIIKGERGDKGDIGEAGPQGPQGLPGPPGPALQVPVALSHGTTQATLLASNTAPGGVAILGEATAQNGAGYGVMGFGEATDGFGVFATSAGPHAPALGVEGKSNLAVGSDAAVRLPLYTVGDSANGATSVAASCASGDIAISGGCSSPILTVRNCPSKDGTNCVAIGSGNAPGNAWLCGIASSGLVSAYAICLKSF